MIQLKYIYELKLKVFINYAILRGGRREGGGYASGIKGTQLRLESDLSEITDLLFYH